MLKPATDLLVSFAPPDIGDRELSAVAEVLQSGWLTTGPKVHAFEAAVAAYTGAAHAVAVNSGTAALHLSLLGAGIDEPSHEVVTSPLTFCATVNAIIHAGGTPVLADIDLASMNLDPAAVEAALTPRTRALLPVHFAGRPAALARFRGIAAARGLLVIDDAAHAFGAASGAQRIGSAAALTAFSFHAVKNITTGEGGMVTTNRADWAERIRIMALHGMSRDAWARYSGRGAVQYEVVEAGFKYNMMDLQAAIGLEQLARVEALQAHRRRLWDRYDRELADLPITRPPAVSWRQPGEPEPGHAHHLFTILVDHALCGWTRDDLAAALRERGIATSVHFKAIHLHRYYAERYGFRRGMFPNAEYVSDRTLSLPLSAGTDEADVDRVITVLHELLA
jgi:dTDP-4-amino-4,6-dideoxygalactose transaminase